MARSSIAHNGGLGADLGGKADGVEFNAPYLSDH